MKRSVLLLALGFVLVIFTAIWVHAAQPAPTVRTYQSGAGEHQYVIPPSGTPYCFNPAPDLPRELPACPSVDWNGAVPPDYSAGPVVSSAKP